MKLWMLVFLAPVLAVGIRPEADDTQLERAVSEIVTTLFDQEGPLHVGAAPEAVTDWMKRAAPMYGEYYLPLAAAPFAPEGDWQGVVYFYIDDPREWAIDLETGEIAEEFRDLVDADMEPYLASIIVTLLCDEYDAKKMGAFLVDLGVELGLDIVPSEEDEGSYFDISELGPELWLGLGEGLIAIEVAM